ncbi:TonB-dependent receptor domain-containing protein [Paucibacter soli]|uniref:TonB-dependent receptor domain-containing protein n=1 Tax=Paucibacter soli TaxID=3133433 RepID=UPI0030A01127
MFKTNPIALAAWLALAAGAPALAQSSQQATLERVEVTGSSIKRIASEGALPVQTLTRGDIERSGATSAEELIQGLPSMQGFQTSSASVNGDGPGGVQNASLHSIGASYTLVLLNGRRLASYSAGSAVNLSSIPLSAVERVEVLTDGASALYGSDAVAGVVNFILRKNQTDFSVSASINSPQKKGGRSGSFALSKGFGDLEKDGFNVLLSYARDEQKELNAADRDFGKSGIVPFTHEGKAYSLYESARNTTPASVTLGLKTPVTGPNNASVSAITFSPNYLKDGKCASNTVLTTVLLDKACQFDYASTVQLVPISKRDSLFLSGNWRIGKDTNLFMEGVASKFSLKERHAPVAQAIGLNLADPLYASYVAPYLAQFGIDPVNVNKATTNNRFVDAGGRSDLFETQARHLAVGIEGVLRDFDYTLSYVHSTSTQDTMYDGGYMRKSCYNDLLAAGKYNPFAASGGNTALLAPCVLKEWNQTIATKLDIVSARASGELFKAPGGAAMLGAGLDYTKQGYDYTPSALAMGPNSLHSGTDAVFGRGTGALPVGANRKNWGAFAELMVPLHKTLEASAALRYDDYTAVRNRFVFDLDGKLQAPATQGNASSKATYKLAMRYRPIDALMVRASYGTGFKVPNMDLITQAISGGSNTSGSYPCPVKAPDPRAVNCEGTTQYDLLSGGNPLTGANGLKPEESRNMTLGLRVEPTRELTAGLDYWSVKMKNQIVGLPESAPFTNPAAYDNLIRTVYDAARGSDKLAVLLPNFNLGRSTYSGIDWDASLHTTTALGRLTVGWSGTYMLKAESDDGTGKIEVSLGRFDAYNSAVSRVIQRVTANLQTGGMFSHTLAWNWRSGYHDAVQDAGDGKVRSVNADGSLGAYASIVRDVQAYSTFDWQTRANVAKGITVTLGIKNLLDEAPPLSIRTSGGGNQIGYDGRYASPLGRQFYLSGSFSY